MEDAVKVLLHLHTLMTGIVSSVLRINSLLYMRLSSIVSLPFFHSLVSLSLWLLFTLVHLHPQ